MKIVVCSVLDGKTSGYIVFNVSPNILIEDLLNYYCLEKGIDVCEGYVLERKGNKILDISKTLDEEKISANDTIYLTQTDKLDGVYGFGSWWVVVFLALLIGCVGLAFSLYSFLIDSSSPQKYGLVIDAGSTHSELFVFSWRVAEVDEEPEVQLIHNCVMYGGVAEFRDNLDGLHSYFHHCIAEARKIIPPSFAHKTPLILAATAGMRILRAYDPDGARLILASTRELLRKKTEFKITYHDVFVATGMQEGISGWAALNYLMENFQESDSDDAPASALDLGGASVQVTTEVDDHTSRWPAVNITIFNNTYRVFSKSFLCYGVSEAMHRYQFFLIDGLKNKSKDFVPDPCLPKGFQESFMTKDFSLPCIFTNKSGYSFSQADIQAVNRHIRRYMEKYLKDKFVVLANREYTPNSKDGSLLASTNDSEVAFVFEGRNDVGLCRKRVRSLFSYEKCKKNFIFGDCIDKHRVPPYTGELVGFSSIFRRLMPLLGIDHRSSSLRDFEKAVLTTCAKSSKDLIKLHPDVSEYMLKDLCFDSMYVYTLLTEGLGITPRTWKNIVFTDKIHEQEVVWALGLMLNRTAIPAYQTRPKVATTDGFTYKDMLLCGLFVSFVACAVFILWVQPRSHCCARKPMRKGNVEETQNL